jgi:hypothetical protein
MCKSRMCVVVVMVVGFSGSVSFGDITSGLVGYWPLDGGAVDATGNGADGTINGNVILTEDRLGNPEGAMMFPGESGAHVDLGDPSQLNIAGQMTLAAWISLDAANTNNGRIIAKMAGGGSRSWNLNIEASAGGVANPATFQIAPDGSQILGVNDSQPLPIDEWVHMAGIFRPGQAIEIYVNGELRASVTTGIPTHQFSANGSPVLIGSRGACGNCGWMGGIDEVRIYNRALSAADVMELYRGDSTRASSPDPGHEITDVAHDVCLGWTAGEFAVAHDVYLGTDYDDVNDAARGNGLDALIGQDLTNAFLDCRRLDFNTTYYWRVDEVNGTPDYAVLKGPVWSFTVEPMAIPIETITATASGASPGMEAVNTVNASGLDRLDQHSAAPSDMWLTRLDDSWIQYEFDRAYKLHQLLVWNSNQAIESFVGFGLKEATIETSMDGETWTPLPSVGPFGKASGLATYTANTLVDFNGVVARFVKIMPLIAHGLTGQVGLSEVRFLTIPTTPREPNPTDGAAIDGVDVTLQWRGGREADTHEVVLSNNQAVVEDGSAVVGTSRETSFRPASLDLGSTYYWQINEVNNTEIPTTWQGERWTFSTPEYLVVDDFDSYSGNEGEEIFMTWQDGFGGNTALGGSTTGHIDGPFVETAIVRSGNQSMPIYYDNDGGFIDICGGSFVTGFSEVLCEFDTALDWTRSGIKTLGLWFHGAAGNMGQLYVKINDVKIPYDGDADNLALTAWQAWNIDLAASGVGVQQVTSLAIGIDGGGSGILYVDDIRLYADSRELITPIDPGNAGLVAHYKLDQNATDSSGNGHNGTVEGAAGWISPGQDGTGSCKQFGSDDARITVEPFDVIGTGITLAAWINPLTFMNDARMISKSEGGGTALHYWAMVLSGTGEKFLQFRLKTDVGNTTSRLSGGNALVADEWAHVAVAWDAGDPVMRQYKNGQEIDSVGKAGNAVAAGPDVKIGIGNQSISALAEGPGNEIRPFDGLIDEVRVYERGLSPLEIGYLAGRTRPFDKPF